MNKVMRTVALATFLVAALSSPAAAQIGQVKRIRFPRGGHSATLKGAVVRGTQNRYLVGARQGQTMTVKITSVERNASFTVYYAGEQESLEGSADATTWTGRLIADNDYVVVVSPVRGNATYALTVSVE